MATMKTEKQAYLEDTKRENDRVLQLLMNSFPHYLDYVYDHINLPQMTPLQGRIAEIMGGDDERLILEAARGTGKSYIGAIYATWRLLRDSDEKILIVSAAAPKAIEISTFIRGLLERVPLLNHLRPNKAAGHRDSVQSFDISGCEMSIAPSVAVLGISGQLTGRRATFILSDDVEVPANSSTELQREQLLQKVQEYESLLIPDKPSKVYFLGTPQSMESIYNKLPFTKCILPAQVPADPSIYNGYLDHWIMKQGKAGEAVDKIRFPLEVLAVRRAGMGNANYQLQFMLDTTLSDANRFPLKIDDLVVMAIDDFTAPVSVTYSRAAHNAIEDIPNVGFNGNRYHKPSLISTEVAKYDKVIMSIDPAGSGDDEATYAVIGVLGGNLHLITWGGFRNGFSNESLVGFAMIAKKYNVNEVVPEKNFGAGMFTELLRKVLIAIYPCHIVDDFNVSGQKEMRIINNVEPLMSNHQLIINEQAIRDEMAWVDLSPADNLQYSLMYQLSHLTRDKQSLVHDDRLDALALGCQYLYNMVVVDADEVVKRIEKKRLDDELNAMIAGKLSEFMSGTTEGMKPKRGMLGNVTRR